eukprot:TRINITY_DN5339_c0_g1_i1.p1 TRINITY_DN5339_c0_g1~~TRINITY_DN5339_c0_g1_i1.p1  ORF type:complete len:459 (-),score=185.00 TRINITY_DN5339_c0_g1_i1:63-1439(-)
MQTISNDKFSDKYGSLECSNSQINEQAENELLKKIDWKIIPLITLLYLLSFLDRSNIGNVRFDLLNDLEISERQFGFAVGIFYVGYILFEIPANLILRASIPSIWIGSIAVAWGICTIAMIFVNDFKDLILVRIFLGITEAGFFPGAVFYLTFWYKKQEQGRRLGLLVASTACAVSIGGILAYLILQIQSDSFGLKPWQWLFLIEGFPSILTGIFTCFYLPNYPNNAKWLTEEERKLAKLRLPDIEEKKSNFEFDKVLDILLNTTVWFFALIQVSIVTPSYAVTFYIPSIINEIGFTKFQSNLLSSPVFAVTAIMVFLIARQSDIYGDRSIVLISCASISAVAFVLLGIASMLQQHMIALCCIFVAAATTYSQVPVSLAWLNSTITGSTNSATATALVIGFSNLGGILGPNIYSWLYIIPNEEQGIKGSFSLGHFAMAISSFCSICFTFLLRLKLKGL